MSTAPPGGPWELLADYSGCLEGTRQYHLPQEERDKGSAFRAAAVCPTPGHGCHADYLAAVSYGLRPARGVGATRGSRVNGETSAQGRRGARLVLPVYMIPLISTDMLMLLLPLGLVKFAAESWRLSQAVGRRNTAICSHTHVCARTRFRHPRWTSRVTERGPDLSPAHTVGSQ